MSLSSKNSSLKSWLGCEQLESRLVPNAANVGTWLRDLQMDFNFFLDGFGGVLDRPNQLDQDGNGTPDAFRATPLFAYQSYLGLLSAQLPPPVTGDTDFTRAENLMLWHGFLDDFFTGAIDDQWYADTLGNNPTLPVLGSTPPASQDAYAAALLDLAWEHIYRGGDPNNIQFGFFIPGGIQRSGDLLLSLIDADGLTRASNTDGTKFLANNAQAFAGLQAAGRLERDVFNDSARSQLFFTRAEELRAAILREFYNPATSTFRTAKNVDGTFVETDTNSTFANTTAILTPAIFGVIERSGPIAQGQMNFFNSRFPNWHTQLTQPGGLAWASLGYAARITGDTARADAQATRFMNAYFTASPFGGMSNSFQSVDAGYLLQNISPINRAPIANDTTVGVAVNASVPIALAGIDPDGDALTLIVTRQPQFGTVVFDGTNYVYTPNPRFIGTDSFAYRVDDGNLDSANEGIVTINVFDTQPVLIAPGNGTFPVFIRGPIGKADTQVAVPFESYRGPVSVALGDVDGNVSLDYIFAGGPGGGPRVSVVSASTGQVIRNFFAYAPTFTGGVQVASGDMNGDGYDDIITVPGQGGGPHVTVFSGLDGRVLRSFFAYDQGFTGGLTVAVADVDGDGKLDIITGTASGGSPHVRVFNYGDLNLIANFFAFDAGYTGGISVAAGDLDGDKRAEIVVGGSANSSNVRVFSGFGQSEVRNFEAFSPGFAGGVRVAVGDINLDGQNDIIAGAGPGAGAHVRGFNFADLSEIFSEIVAPDFFRGGVFVA